MKFKEIEIKEQSLIEIKRYIKNEGKIIYRNGEICHADIICNEEFSRYHNIAMIVRYTSGNGVFSLCVFSNEKFFKITGACKDITVLSSFEDDIKMFRDMYKACNYDMKAFLTLLKL